MKKKQIPLKYIVFLFILSGFCFSQEILIKIPPLSTTEISEIEKQNYICIRYISDNLTLLSVKDGNLNKIQYKYSILDMDINSNYYIVHVNNNEILSIINTISIIILKDDTNVIVKPKIKEEDIEPLFIKNRILYKLLPEKLYFKSNIKRGFSWFVYNFF